MRKATILTTVHHGPGPLEITPTSVIGRKSSDRIGTISSQVTVLSVQEIER